MDRPNPDEIDLSDEDFYDHDNDDYEVASDPAMAATLGFTSFGSVKPATNNNHSDDQDDSRPSKKRRLSHSAGDRADKTVIPGLGADTAERLPMTAQRAQVRAGKQNAAAATDEISYDDEITYDDDDGVDDDFELDTNPEVDSDAPPTPSGPSTPAATTTTTAPAPSSATATALPTRDRGGASGTGTGRGTHDRGRGRGRGGDRGGRGGGRGGGNGGGNGPNPLWYVDYYDRSSNENPWEGMEKHKGLPPVGTWLPRYWDTVAAGDGAPAAGVATATATATATASDGGGGTGSGGAGTDICGGGEAPALAADVPR